MGNEYEFQVALSFAGEQRAYVKSVSDELSKLEIRHFYDNKEKANLWGKNLTRYLDDVYFAKSQYVVVFVSKEYREKIWTKWEMSSAQDRALRQPDEYMLPVYFDDVRISGLVDSLGHIDARTTGPQELAELIYAKVNGASVSNRPSNDTLPLYHAPIQSSSEFHPQEAARLYELYESRQNSIATVVVGEKGVGKKTVVHAFLDGKDCVVHVRPARDLHYQYEALIHALGDHNTFFTDSNDLQLPERLKKHILGLCNKKPLILYFEEMDQYDPGLTDLVFELCSELLLHHPDYKTFILFEYDSDNHNGTDLEKQFYGFPPALLEFIPFERLGEDALRDYLNKLLGTIQIAKEDMDYILSSCYGNVMYLNVIINYLRMKGVLKRDSGQLTCAHIMQGSLTDVLGAYIRQRYDRLDANLKEVLAKSSVIGNSFTSELLSKPFGILHAEELLDKIENVSLLIKREDEGKFSFESPDSLQIINDSIQPDESQQWHRILAKYFMRRLSRLKNGWPPLTPDQEIVHLCSIMRHNRYAGDYEEAISYSCRLIEKYLSISDYSFAIQTIAETRALIDLVDDTTGIEKTEYDLSVKEAKCLFDTGKFDEALPLYQKCVECHPIDIEETELLSIQLDSALCHYMDGKTTSALELAEQVRLRLEPEEKDSLLYCKALSLLASFNDCTGKIKEKQRYYIDALNTCRANGFQESYYGLLRKASMVYDELLAVDMYPAAVNYFEERQKFKSLAEIQHNIATDNLYLARPDQIMPPLVASQRLFESFGSKMIHYPLNTQGIYEAVFDKDFHKALATFQRALTYQTECYSQVVLRINMVSCYLKLGALSDAQRLLLEMDRLLDRPENSDVFEYEIYRRLGWSLYYYYTGECTQCIKLLSECAKLPELEPRFLYMCRFLTYLAKRRNGVQARRPGETPCKPILKAYFDLEAYFFTLRFFE